MGYMHKILGKITGIKTMIKKNYKSLSEEEFQQIEKEVSDCSLKIARILWEK